MTEVDLGGNNLALLTEASPAKYLYVLAHGAGAGMRHTFMTALATALAVEGVSTLRWEFPYMRAGKARTDRAEIAEAAVRATWLAARQRFSQRGLPMFAGGKSFGGRMTSRAHAAEPLPGLAGIAFVGFPLHPADAPATERADHLASTSGPLLFVQGDRDKLAELPLLRPIVKSLGRRAKLHVVEHADHGFDVLVRSARTAPDVLREIARTIAAWMERVMPIE